MTFTNEPETTNLAALAQKLDSKGQTIQNVVFKVNLYDGEYDSVEACEVSGKLKRTWYLKSYGEGGNIEFKDENIADDYDATYRSDDFYVWNNKIVIPIGCTVTYQEVKTPAKYTIDPTTTIWKTEKTSQ